jgi:hypothetical protein
MRAPLACLLLATLAAPAAADGKIDQLAKTYERETRVCGKNLRGITVVLERGQQVAASDAELASDLAELSKSHATVKSHCDAVASMLAFLLGASSESYKTIQKEFDERDIKIRAERVSSKQALTDVQPLIQRVVPRMNKAIANADASARLSTREQKAQAESASARPLEKTPDKTSDKTPDKTPAPVVSKPAVTSTKPAVTDKQPPAPVKKPFMTFRSGRTVELPEPAEAWRFTGDATDDVAEYSFGGVTGAVAVRGGAGASCENVRASAKLLVRGTVTASEPSAELKALKPAWTVSWTHGDAQLRATCIASGSSVVVGTVEAMNGGKPALDTMLARMLTARLARR